MSDTRMVQITISVDAEVLDEYRAMAKRVSAGRTKKGGKRPLCTMADCIRHDIDVGRSQRDAAEKALRRRFSRADEEG
jgi:hypothetical protein